MNKQSLREDASLYFLPFILGNTPTAHTVSLKIFHKYGIQTVIVGKKHSVIDTVDFSSRTVTLVASESSALLKEQLIALYEQCPFTLPLLIPCTEEYKKAVDEHRDELERIFIISDPETVFLSSPLTTIP